MREAIVLLGSEGKRIESNGLSKGFIQLKFLKTIEIDCGNKEKEDTSQPVIRFVSDDQAEIVRCN